LAPQANFCSPRRELPLEFTADQRELRSLVSVLKFEWRRLQDLNLRASCEAPDLKYRYHLPSI